MATLKMLPAAERIEVYSEVRKLCEDISISDDIAEQPTKRSRENAYDEWSDISKKHDELDSYLSESCFSDSDKMLQYWQEKERVFPKLAAIARKVLAIPATNASSERTFSNTGNTVTAKRSCLLPENVNNLTFLHSFQKQLPTLPFSVSSS